MMIIGHEKKRKKSNFQFLARLAVLAVNDRGKKLVNDTKDFFQRYEIERNLCSFPLDDDDDDHHTKY